MKRAAVFCLAAACFLWAGVAAQASEINSDTITWGSSITASPRLNWVGGPGNGVLFMPGTGFSVNQSAPFTSTDLSTKLFAFSSASIGNPQQVKDAPFSLVMNVTDLKSGISGAVTFTGTLDGKIWSSGSTLTATFNSAMDQQLHLGHDIYNVAFESFVPPSGNGPNEFGSFVFDVSVHHNPEPSSLVLAAIGVPLFGMIRRRRRKS
jgi:hypothetical protein